MNQSLFNGVNGIKAQNVGVDITANNIANVNTIGFKRTSSEFADIFYKRIASQSTNPTEVGGGTTLAASKIVYEQSSFMDGEGEFDVGLNGKGFFGVRSGGTTYYTRNGEFVRDANGYLVDASGNYVLGTMNPNFQAITYSDRVAQQMGQNSGTSEYIRNGYTVANPSQSFDLSRNTAQSQLFVPTNLYYFPEVTTEATFRGTLSAVATTRTQRSTLNDNALTLTKNVTNLTLSGTLDNNLGATNGDTIEIVLNDKDGKTFTATATVGANSTFNATIDPTAADFDRASAVVQSAKLKKQNNGGNGNNEEDLANNLPTLTKTIPTATISGDGSNFTLKNEDGGEAQKADVKAGDIVLVTLTDNNGQTYSTQATLGEDLKFTLQIPENSGLNLENASISSTTLSATREFREDKVFSARIYNLDGSTSTLRYTLSPEQNRAEGENYVYSVTAGVYNEDGSLAGGLSTGRITFNTNGALIENTLQSVPNPNGGSIAVNLGTPTNSPATNGIGAGWDGVYINTRSSATTDSIDSSSNGSAEGYFSRYQIGTDGSLLVQFTNGKTATIGKIALYTFINEQGLASMGSNNFIATANSGPASFLYDSTGKLVYTATFVGNQLETSNTDLSTELTNLIVMQRAFEASSKSITTSDDMIQTAIGLRK